MKTLILIPLGLALSLSANAQVEQEQIVEVQKEQVTTAQPEAAATSTAVEAAPKQEVVIIQGQQAAPAATVVAPQVQAQQVQAQVVTQPTTLVESSPLEVSNAEKLRRARQNAEIQTEQRIVEKLEKSRLEDEQKRLKQIFGQGNEAPTEAAQPAAPVQPQVIVVQPQAVPVVSAEAKTESAATEVKEEAKSHSEYKRRMSFGANIGTIDYEAINIESDFAGGFSLGYRFRPRLDLEGGFNYSRHIIQEPFATIQEVDQYNFSLGVRYAFLPYFVSPVVGALASYTHRSYSVQFLNTNEIESDALDAGFLVGVDMNLTENLSLSADYRRYINLENRVRNNDPLNLDTYPRLEDSDYDMTSLALRYIF